MPYVGIACIGKGYLARVFSDDLNSIAEEKDTLSLASLGKYLSAKKDGHKNIVFPLAKRNIPDNHQTLDIREYNLYLRGLLEGLEYSFYQNHPRTLEQEEANKDREKRLNLLRKKRKRRRH